MSDNWLEELLGKKREELRIVKTHITDKKLLDKLKFPIDTLAPIGTFNVTYYEELEEKEVLEDKKKVVNLIDSKKLQEALKNKQLEFCIYYPSKSDIVEGYGAKFQEVAIDYKGFGLYHITVSNGLKKRAKKDRRWLEVDKDIASPKEELFIAYDDEIKGYRRVHKNTFISLIQEFEELKYSSKIEDLIIKYKGFFNAAVLSPIPHQQVFIKGDEKKDTAKKYRNYANYFLENIPTMRDYYFYYSLIGELQEQSYKFIEQQIDKIEEAAQNIISYVEEELSDLLDKPIEFIEGKKTLIDLHKDLWNILSEAFSEKYWIDVNDGSFYENIKTFYLRYTTTDEFVDDTVEAKKRLATILKIVSEEYYNLRDQRISTNTFNTSGVFYEGLEKSNSTKKLDEIINDLKPTLDKILASDNLKKKYPEIATMGYLFQSVETD